MSVFSRLIRLFASSFLVTLIPILLPIPNSLLSVSTQAQTSPDQKAEADRLLNQGIDQANIGQLNAAILSWQQALKIYRAIKDRQGEGRALGNLGIAYDSQGKYEQSIEYEKQFLTLAHEMKDRQGEGNALGNLGNAHLSQGKYEQAIEYYQQALAILREIKDRQNEGGALGNLGIAYYNQGKYEQAIEYEQQWLAIAREFKDIPDEARALDNLGNTYLNFGKYYQAIEHYRQALIIYRKIKNSQGEGRVLGNRGLVYFNLGKYQQAIDDEQQYLTIARQIKDYSGQGKALNNVGNIYNRLGKYDQAINYYQQALAIAQKIKNPQSEGRVLGNLGIIYDRLGKYDQAINYHQQALAIDRKINDHQGEAQDLANLGIIYNRLGKYDQAFDCHQQALAISYEIKDPQGESIVLNNIGTLLEEQNQAELAVIFYKQSVNVREGIRQDIQKLPREDQVSYTKNVVAGTYRNLASLLLQKNRVMEALQILDLLKVQELQDYLRNVQGNEKTVKGIELFPQEQKILQDYTAIQAPAIRLGAELADLRQLQTRTPTQQQRLQEIEKIQAQTNQKMSEFLKIPAVVALSQQIQQSAPQQNLTLPAYQDLQTRLQRLGKRIALFYTLVLDDRLELVLLPPGKPPIHRSVKMKRTKLEKMIEAFRQDLQNPNSEVKPTAQKLYNQLIKPIETDLKQADVQTVIYAPDGQMRYIPLAALYDGKQWLTERYQINYLTALALTKLEPESTTAPRVLAGAFTQGSYSVQVAGQTYDFQGLRFAKSEIEGLGAAIPNTTKLFDKDFNRDAILSQIKNYSIVHMATHAVFVKGAPEDSFILMGDGNRINLKEIEEWKLPDVTLVVLSACQTALGGDLGNGLEILGFGYQLQRTGVRASIASLWEVNDGGTQTLMDTLYARLKSGKITKAEAIREAQIAMITGKNQSTDSKDRSSVRLTPGNSGQSAPISLNLSHPYYWAPFILIGNGL